ncbi:MAG TPA: cyclodeaminase/cyclohydrolase family protein [Chitinophagales bacterium]|nr:cyclodeaminase/cyclohydrolase family protein [Chitinophagales bacterium]
MIGNLLQLETKELLTKFGAGNHKPGSGSAAAFNGLLAANLIHTVIALTTEEKREKAYGIWFEQLHQFDSEIISRIIPDLEKLFEKDSVLFDQVIKLREQRNNEKNLIVKTDFEIQHLSKLHEATDLPILICNICLEVGEISEFVFRNGFQAARGDSFVALSSALGAVTGCLSIVELNLLSFKPDDWTENIRSQVFKLRKSYSKLLDAMAECSEILKNEVEQKISCDKEVEKIIKSVRGKPKLSNRQIEEAAIKLQRLIWKNKDLIWNVNPIDNPIEILKPDTVLKKVLGYQCYRAQVLNTSIESFEPDDIAGIIDQRKKVVFVSNQYPDETQKFTIAHELGHAIFHEQEVLHRDRPLDGSFNGTSRDPKEYQADKFATYFLMPAKQIHEVFQEIFQQAKFTLNEDNAFKLAQASPMILRKQTKNIRGLSRKLASTNIFGPTTFNPMNLIFGVSVETMAIRLEELKLLEF